MQPRKRMPAATARWTAGHCAGIVVTAFALITVSAATASAQTVVTVCGQDSAGGGTNLSAALAVGGSIVIRCGTTPQTIEMTQTYAMMQDTSIDGEGRVTLTGNGSRPFFTNARTLTLNRLTVRNQRPGGAPGAVANATAVVVGGRVELTQVRTESTIVPYDVADLTATDSVFESNGDPMGQSYRAVIEAETIALRRTMFNRNFDHPIGGGASPAAGRPPASRTIFVEDSSFSENRFPLLVPDAALVIRRSTFTNNGMRAQGADRMWACCAGAVTVVHSIAEIEDSQFSNNGSSGFGGALTALASRVTLARTLFDNNAARVGGAVMFWGREVRTNVWSTGPIAGPLALTLERVRFRANSASEVGGALAWSGAVTGDSALFVNNRARRGGAVAHWSAAPPLDADFADVLTALADLTQPASETMALSRGAFFDNVAAQQGGALDGGDAIVRLGNALVARNVVEMSGAGSALAGNELTVVNGTVVGNRAAGIALPAGGRSLRLTNTIVADNERGNCGTAAGTLTADASNLQFPGASCGTAARSAAPALGSDYAPSLLSPARYAGHVSTCLGEPLVAGRDLHGTPRGNTGTCAIGAIEPDITRDLFANTPLEGAPGGPWRWARWLLLLFLLLGLILGWICARRWRARRRAHAAP